VKYWSSITKPQADSNASFMSEGATVRPTTKQSNAVRSPNATPPSIAGKTHVRVQSFIGWQHPQDPRASASSRTELPSIQSSKSTSANNATPATPSPPIRSPTKLKTLSVMGSVRTARLTSQSRHPHNHS
jgi:pyrimidine and pyridine-specific 5'-nucleotidase